MADTLRSASPSKTFRSKRYDFGDDSVFTKVYVKNLDDNYQTEDDVWNTFRNYGDVTDINVLKDSSGRSVGVAYVTYKEHYMAVNACLALNGIRNKWNQTMYVERAHSRNERLERAEQHERVGIWRVYVKNLNDRVDEHVLFDAFSRFGTIVSYKVFVNENGDSLCYGFVAFLTEEAAVRAITKANGIRLYGDQITVGKLLKLSQLQPPIVYGRRILIKGITNHKILRQTFRNYGCIEDIEVKETKAFLTFTDKYPALKAVADSPLIANGVHITVTMAAPDPKEETRAKHKACHLFECPNCQTIQSIGHQIGFGCEHQFCWECAKTRLESNINVGAIHDLKCLKDDCEKRVDPRLVKILVSDGHFVRYEICTRS